MNPKTSKTVKLALYLATVVAIGWFLLVLDWSSLSDVSIEWGWLALATAAGLAFRYLGVLVWRMVLVRLGATELPSFPVLADVYAKAWLARYIPGTVPWIAGKIYLAAEHGLAKSRLAVSVLIEAAAQVVGVGTVSLMLLASDERIADVSPGLRWLVAAGAVVLVVAIAPPVFNRLLSLALRLARRKGEVSVRWNAVATPVAMYGLGAIVSGASYVLVVFSLISDVAVNDLAYLLGAFGFAGVVGMLTPFVPSGLGTRDGVQLLLLMVIFPVPVSALIVVFGRAWSAIVDVLFWTIAAAIRGRSHDGRGF